MARAAADAKVFREELAVHALRLDREAGSSIVRTRSSRVPLSSDFLVRETRDIPIFARFRVSGGCGRLAFGEKVDRFTTHHIPNVW